MIKGKFSPSIQSTAKANTVYSFAKANTVYSFAKAKCDYSLAKAVIKYSLATAYSYLDEKGLNKLFDEVIQSLDSILIETHFVKDFSDDQIVNSRTIIEAAKVLSDVYSGFTDQIDILKIFGRDFSEQQFQSDYINYINTIKGIADTVLPVESLDRTVQYHRTFSDSVTVPDRIVSIFFGDVEVDGIIFDPFGVDDDPQIDINKPFSESSSTIDVYSSVFTTAFREAVDSPDAFNRILSYIRSYSDAVTPSEDFDKVVGFNRNFNENVDNIETTTKDIGTLYSDEVINSDDKSLLNTLQKQDTQDSIDDERYELTKPQSDSVQQSDDERFLFDSLKTEEQPQQDNTTLSNSALKSDQSEPVDFKYIDFSKNVIFAPYSYYFNGSASNDYVDYTINPSIVPYGTEDWTIEGWIYPTANYGGGIYSTSYLSGYGIEIVWMNSKRIRVTGDNGNAFQLDSTYGDTPLNGWTYFSVTRESNTIRIFINGTLTNSITYSGDFDYGSATKAAIGYGSGSSFYTGYISNIRVVIGTSLYTATYIPPVSDLTSIPGTQLLTCQNFGFFDNSPNNLLIQPHGNVQTIPFTVFVPADRVESTDVPFLTSGLNKSDEQTQTDEINYVNDFNRDFSDSQTNEDSSYIDTSVYMEMESVILSDIVEVIYYVGRIFNDNQFVVEIFNRIIEFIRNYEDTVTPLDDKHFDFVQGNQNDFAVPVDLLSLQSYKYPDETQTQQDTGSLVTSDYVTDYVDYFSEYYVGEVRTF